MTLSNKLDQVKSLINDNLFHEDLLDEDFFYFNFEFDSNNMPVIGDGSDDNHLHIMMSSKKLLNQLEYNGVTHLDGTYKITTNGFPLVVYGISDMHGRFHPICFMLTSHETEQDFKFFFDGLIKQTELLNIEFNPDFTMIDANKASLNAIKQCLPYTEVLMC